ncbi:hypothetical protein C4K09_1377 [Pseudomonas chlororaphis subsp. aureofaciens]|nr:hypothetical protein C4K09_1377 [Pseudomonas chlororaphis subsp. aureofaciens]
MSVDKIEKLLKFLPPEDYVLDSLKDEKVWFSYLKNLNDPFEGNVRFSKLEREEVINVFLEVVTSKGAIARRSFRNTEKLWRLMVTMMGLWKPLAR